MGAVDLIGFYVLLGRGMGMQGRRINVWTSEAEDVFVQAETKAYERQKFYVDVLGIIYNRH